MYTTKKDNQSLYQAGTGIMETGDHFKNGAKPAKPQEQEKFNNSN
jgi:hypothetical protein